MIAKHREAPHLRELQRTLAHEVTVMVHSQADYDSAVEASEILFGKATSEALAKIDERTFLAVFEGVPTFDINKSDLTNGVSIVDLLTDLAPVFPSKGELRRLLSGGGVSINKDKIESADLKVTSEMLINGKYLLIQKGKKNYFLITAK